MSANFFREQLGIAIERRGDLTHLHSQQGFQVYPGAMVLADLLLRDVVAGIGRGLDGFHPAATLHDRIRLEVAYTGAGSDDLSESPQAWELLCGLVVASDAPAVYESDSDGIPASTHRQLFLGQIPVSKANALANLIRLDSFPAQHLAASGMRLVDGEVVLAPVARLVSVDGPVVDGAKLLGLGGCPIHIRVIGAENPLIRVEIRFPWHRVPAGVAGGRGVLMEDVRGVAGVADFLFQQGLGRAVAAILHKLDAGADALGQPQVGFRERVSVLWDDHRLGAEDLLDAVTDVLPALAAQYKVAVQEGHELSGLVLEQAIVDLVTRMKSRPTLLREAVELALKSGLAPHVVSSSGEVYWIPVGEYPDSFSPDQLDTRVLPAVAGIA